MNKKYISRNNKEYYFEEGAIWDSWRLSKYALDLHFDNFDTEGIEESDLRERIEKESLSFKLEKIPVSQIEVDLYYLDEDKIEEYAECIEDIPPVILYKQKHSAYKYGIIDGGHRTKAYILANKEFILSFVGTRSI